MRNRREIEVDVDKRGVDMGTILEVLLDIRVLLEDLSNRYC